MISLTLPLDFKDSEKKEREGRMGRNELRDRDGERERHQKETEGCVCVWMCMYVMFIEHLPYSR